MARYLYRCDICGHEDLVELAMDAPKDPRACDQPTCFGTARRVFTTSATTWRDIRGHAVRPPSKPWNWPEGEPVDTKEFKRRNPTAGAVGSNPRG